MTLEPRNEPAGWNDDPGFLAQRAAEAHLDACQDAMFRLDDGADFADVNDPASAPYCGCTTCDTREVLHAAWPILEEYFRRKYSGQPDGSPEPA